ncbi:MAG: hypothetical protein INR73_18595 [Williamsia sp.]|nr:hypothetical protein [Williamsia sp.]
MKVVEYIEFGILYATVVLFIARYKQLDQPFKRLIFYLLNLALGNTLAFYLFACLHKENLWLFHFLTPMEYTALCIVFHGSLSNPLLRKAILLSLPCFITLCILLTRYVNKMDENDAVARIAEALLVTTWILFYFRELSTTEKILDIQRDPLFWVYTGLMIYFWGTLFLQGLLNYLNRLDRILANRLYTWQYVFEYTSLLTINMGLFCDRIFRRRVAG